MQELETEKIGERPNFFLWYFGVALHGLMEIWKNFLLFSWQYFSINLMLATLFSPWRRDVEIKNWQGFQLGRYLELFFGNMFSRLMGAFIRFLVIIFGLVIFFFILIFGIEALVLWVCIPILALIAIFYGLSQALPIIYVLSGVFIWIAVTILLYFYDTKKDLLSISTEELLKHPVLNRIAARLGLPGKRFPKDILLDEVRLKEFLQLQALSVKDFRYIMSYELKRWQQKLDLFKFWKKENLEKIVPIGRQWNYGFTPKLDRYSQELTKWDLGEYKDASLVGRENEYEILKMIMQRPDQNCALLVGPAGVGKKTLLHELARNARLRKEVELEDHRMLLLDLGRAISDALNKGYDVENMLRNLFYEASFAGNVILLIEHMEFFLGSDGSSIHPDIAPVLNEFLDIPTFQLIALSTPKEYHQLIERHENIIKYFEVIEMREPSVTESIKILLLQMEKYEKNRVLFSYKSLKKIVTESGKTNWKFPLPERAIDLAQMMTG